jgi:acetyl esterase/lipase
VNKNRHGLLLLLAFFAIACLQFACAQAPDDSVDKYLNLEYARPDGHALHLDLYVPKGATGPLPLVMWVHGGGWLAGDRSDGFFLPVVKSGFAVASIDYRLSQVAIFPAQIYDCKAAVRWLRANAAKYNINPNKIGAAGASAGGHLVALLGTTNGDPQFEGNEGATGVSSDVQAVVDYFGPTDFTAIRQDATPEQTRNLSDPVTRLFGGPVSERMDLARLASPMAHVSSKACPFFIVQGDQDNIVPPSQSVHLNDALKKAGVLSELVIVKGAGHGFDDPASYAAAIGFLKKQLQAP